MQVETFEATEVAADGTQECTAEAIALVEKLGLTGQKALLGGEGNKSRCPYRKMTKDELFVYGHLCPVHTELCHYADAPIPLRVLQVAAHAEALGIFRKLFVWHPESADIKDPVLVGERVGRHQHGWETVETWILARWGEVLDPFDKLKEAASAAFKTKLEAKLKTIVSQAQSELAMVQASTAMDGFRMPDFNGVQR